MSRGPHESEGEFQQLLTHLQHEWRPVDMMEQMYVERLEVTYWRWRRVIEAETAELSRKVDEMAAAAKRREEGHTGRVALLRRMTQQVTDNGNISGETRSDFEDFYSRCVSLASLRVDTAIANADLARTSPDRQAAQNELTRAVAELRRELEVTEAEIHRQPALATPASTLTSIGLCSRPDDGDLRARYEVMFQRQFDHALERLLEQQEQRSRARG